MGVERGRGGGILVELSPDVRLAGGAKRGGGPVRGDDVRGDGPEGEGGNRDVLAAAEDASGPDAVA